MSTDINADSNDGSYYSHWLRRKVRKPTPILYNMIEDIRYETKKVKEEIQECENLPIRKKLRSYDKLYKDKKVIEDQICERCKTHPDDVNWDDPPISHIVKCHPSSNLFPMDMRLSCSKHVML